jgi:hypothetical protein
MMRREVALGLYDMILLFYLPTCRFMKSLHLFVGDTVHKIIRLILDPIVLLFILKSLFLLEIVACVQKFFIFNSTGATRPTHKCISILCFVALRSNGKQHKARRSSMITHAAVSGIPIPMKIAVNTTGDEFAL